MMNHYTTNIRQWLLLLVCIMCTLPSWAEEYSMNGIVYELDASSSTAMVKYVMIESLDTITTAEIPSRVAGYDVTSIREHAFEYCSSLTSITIPNSVTSIEAGAFYCCSSLTSITIPNSVTSIEAMVFSGCSALTSITIPNSVTSIGAGAFDGCRALTSITIPNSVTSIGSEAFCGCRALTSITIPNSVTSIGSEAFCGCRALTSITIPNSVTSIEARAFYGCSALTSITIPNSVTSIERSTFENCSALTSITIPNSVTSIESYAFSGCSAVTSFTVDAANPNYISEGLMLFNKDKTKLIRAVGGSTTYNIPNSVTSIESYAFSGCSALTSITIPNSVTSIGGRAFENCSALTSITIPNSVTSIGAGAFYGCRALTSFTVDAANPNYSAEGLMLFNKDKTKLIEAVGGSTTYNIPNSVTSIERSTFVNCSALTSITIPNSVTRIGYGAFEDCSSLTSITISNSVTSIGDWAFYDCSALTSITIPDSVTSIGDYAFIGCNSLNSVLIMSTNTRLGSSSFPSNSHIYYLSNLDNNTKNSVSNILKKSADARDFIANYNTTYNKISKDLQECLESNLQKSEKIAELIGNSQALSQLSTELSKAYNNVKDAVYDQLDLNDNLDMLYAKANKVLPSLDNTPDYSPLESSYTAGSNVLTDASQLSTNKQETEEGDISNLVDGDKNTFFHSTWSATNTDNAFAYLQVDLKDAYQNLLLNYTKRYNFTGNKGYPTLMHVFGTNTPNDEDSWTDCGNVKLNYNEDNNQSGKALVKLGGDYQYIRLQVEKTGGMQKTNGNLYFALSELSICPITAMKEAPYTEKDGLITDASQLSSNYVEPQEGSLAGLIDNNLDTYFHSSWSQSNPTETYHYLQVDLKDAYKQIALKYTRRQNLSADNGTPVTLHVYATNTPDDEDSWTDLGTKTCNYDYDFGETGLLPLDFGGEAYRHIRLTVEATSQNAILNGNLYFYWSELHAYTRASKADVLSAGTYVALTEALTKAKEELDAEWATEATYKALKAAYEAATTETSGNSRLVDFAKSSYLTAYSDHALTVPTGVKAAVVLANGEGIRNDYRYNSGDVIPAQTGVLLKGGKGNSFYLSATESTESAPEDNLLHGTLNDETTNVEGADKYYKLSYDRATGTEIGFYWGAENGGAFINKAGKAFLALPGTLNAAQLAGFSLFDLDNQGTITGIHNAQTAPAATLFKAYDLNGRRINAQSANELSKGIYIINGKKTIIK